MTRARLGYVHEAWQIPEDCGCARVSGSRLRRGTVCVFGLDNAFYGLSKTIPCDGHETEHQLFREAQAARIRELAGVFTAGLPDPGLSPNTTSVHMRMNIPATSGANHRAIALIQAALQQGRPVVVDTDDAHGAGLLLDGLAASGNLQVRGKEDSLLLVLSRFVHADVFVAARSSLSKAAALIRTKGTTYIPVEVPCSDLTVLDAGAPELVLKRY